MPMPHPLDRVVGPRRPIGIGATPGEFRANFVPKPSEEVLSKYGKNPRNAAGNWYEDYVNHRLDEICPRLGLKKLTGNERRITGSLVYRTDKIVDVVLRRVGGPKPDRQTLGLELKFLGGTGSLVSPKSLVDALDFTNRPFHCVYMIDGEGWLEGGRTSSVEYLTHSWEFTCFAFLERTLSEYFQ